VRIVNYVAMRLLFCRLVLYRITIEKEYLKADLFNRTTVEETQEFFDAVAASAQEHQRSRIMISVHSSSSLFTVERSGFLARFKSMSVDPSHKIALVADTRELGFSHQYMEKLAQQKGINVKNFRDERSGIAWFTSGT
jgi:hypothetical protein